MIETLGGYSGRVVVITGAGREPGRMLAEAFFRQGANLALNDINPLGLEETMQRLGGAGKCRDYAYDVARRMPVQAMVNQIMEDWGRIDILINCAAVEPCVPVMEMDEWEWHRTIDVNLSGAFFTIQQVSRVMCKQGGGAIINLAGRFHQEQLPKANYAAFLASQIGLVGLTLAVAEELADNNVSVNQICQGLPGVSARPLAPVLQRELADKDQELPDQLIGVVFYLCDLKNSGLTGQVVSLGIKSVE